MDPDSLRPWVLWGIVAALTAGIILLVVAEMQPQ